MSYVAAHLPHHIQTDMRHLRDIGCTEILFALQENHIRILTGALRYGAAIAKDNGLKPSVVVWGYANTFGGGRISRIMLDDLEMWRVQKDGSPLPYGCLNNPKLVDGFMEITELCRAHGFEGMFVDEPTAQECFCTHCRAKFSEGFGADLLEKEGTDEYRAFQCDTVSRYTRRLCARVKQLDAEMKTMACVMPRDRDCFEAVAAIPELDLFGTDPYWLLSRGQMSIKDACEQARLVREICEENDKASHVWLNCWAIPAGLEEEVYTGGKKLAEVGCDDLYTWSFRGGLGTYEECDNPAKAWDSVVRLYRQLSGV